ncbi:MAG: hypothetical protein ACRD1Y_05025 [Terriglobales bacterium]
MIAKKCQGCGRYFSGQNDGDYSCPDCRQVGVQAVRPLMPLAGSADGWADGWKEPRGPQPALDPHDGRRGARGQAA